MNNPFKDGDVAGPLMVIAGCVAGMVMVVLYLTVLAYTDSISQYPCTKPVTSDVICGNKGCGPDPIGARGDNAVVHGSYVPERGP